MNNTNNQLDDLTLLAGMVKGNMRKIDSLMTDLSDRQADNIDLRKFINVPQPQQPNNSPQMTNYSPAIEHPENNSPQVTSYPTNNSSYSAPATIAEAPATIADDELKQNIESIKLTLEKINVNLTKLTGMFGKVFQSLTKGNKNG
jgi:hypothetical protein